MQKFGHAEIRVLEFGDSKFGALENLGTRKFEHLKIWALENWEHQNLEMQKFGLRNIYALDICPMKNLVIRKFGNAKIRGRKNWHLKIWLRGRKNWHMKIWQPEIWALGHVGT